MKQPNTYLLKCPRVAVTMHQVDVVAKFLREQPRWRWLKDDEVGINTNRYAKKGVEGQHWLWMQENQAHDWKDFCTEWGMRDDPHWITTDRKHLILPGEPFLVDAVGGELWICYENTQGKLFKVAQVSSDMNQDYGNCFNGYALMPPCLWESATRTPVRGV